MMLLENLAAVRNTGGHTHFLARYERWLTIAKIPFETQKIDSARNPRLLHGVNGGLMKRMKKATMSAAKGKRITPGHPSALRPPQNHRFRALTHNHLDVIARHVRISEEDLFTIRVISAVLPFRTNRYVIETLIEWDRIPDDPVDRIIFPQRGMLEDDDFQRIASLVQHDAHGCEAGARS